MEFVSWGPVTFPTEWKVIKFHGSKPPTRYPMISPFSLVQIELLFLFPTSWSLEFLESVPLRYPIRALLGSATHLIWCIMTHRIHGAAIYGAPWIPSIYPSHVSIYTSTMDPMGDVSIHQKIDPSTKMEEMTRHHNWMYLVIVATVLASAGRRDTIYQRVPDFVTIHRNWTCKKKACKPLVVGLTHQKYMFSFRIFHQVFHIYVNVYSWDMFRCFAEYNGK